jgi:hypothetical protein
MKKTAGPRRGRAVLIGLLLAVVMTGACTAPTSQAANAGDTTLAGPHANRTLTGGAGRELSRQELRYINRAVGVDLDQ